MTHGLTEKPRIGVSWITLGQEKSERYLRAVEAAGGEAIPLSADAESWTAELAGLRGLLLTGGGDLDPVSYGEENRGLSTIIIAQRDELELEALQYCLQRRLPVLGICRGIQVINVAMGGSLLQDIDTGVEHQALNGVSSTHPIELQPETQLSEILGGRGRLTVNSRHHQGMLESQVASRMRVSALAPDRVVEGIELPGEQFLLGVQCHPERKAEVPEMAPLFDALVSRARSSREPHPHLR